MGRNLLGETPAPAVESEPLGTNLLGDTPAGKNLLDSSTKKEGAPKSITDRAKSFFSEGALGTAIGAAMPELTTGAGIAAAAFPVTAPMAPYLLGTGQAMRGARLASAGAGLISGLGGEAAAQVSEAYGQPEKTQELWRLAGGAVTPELGNVIKYGAGKILSSTGLASKSDMKSLVGAIADDLGIKEKDLTPSQKSYIENVIKQIRGGKKTDAPLETVYSALEKGAENIVDRYNSSALTLETQAQRLLKGDINLSNASAIADQLSSGARELLELATQRANTIMKTAEKNAADYKTRYQQTGGAYAEMADIDAQGIIQRGKQEADKILAEGTERANRMREIASKAKTSGGERVSTAGTSLTEIGKPQLPTETGNLIRDRIMPLLDKLKKTRSENAELNKGEAFNFAELKEQQGQKVKDTAAFKEAMDLLKADIDTATLGAIKEPLKNIRRALSPRQEDPVTGVVTGKDVTFAGLEQLRRFLRDRAYGLPAEGFDALNQQMAGKLANAVEKIQLEFSPSIEKFLTQYAADSQPLNQFKTRLGKAVAGGEEFDMGRFVTDPADIGKQVFRTETGVKDLINMMGGDAQGAEQIAKGYVLDQLQSPTAAKIKSFMEGPARDWLPQFPGLKAQLETAISRMSTADTVASKRDALSSALRTDASTLLRAAPKEASRVMSDVERQAQDLIRQGRNTEAQLLMKGSVGAERELARGAEKATGELTSAASSAASKLGSEAKQLSAEGEQIKKLILGDSFGAQRVKEVIMSGSPKLWDEVGPIIGQNPEAKRAFVDAVRQVVADAATSGPRAIVDNFNRNIRPALQKTGLMGDKELNMLQAQIDNINRTVDGPQKAGLLQRAISNALTAGGASGLSSIVNPASFLTGALGF
jgi:hypothetical protein